MSGDDPIFRVITWNKRKFARRASETTQNSYSQSRLRVMSPTDADVSLFAVNSRASQHREFESLMASASDCCKICRAHAVRIKYSLRERSNDGATFDALACKTCGRIFIIPCTSPFASNTCVGLHMSAHVCSRELACAEVSDASAFCLFARFK